MSGVTFLALGAAFLGAEAAARVERFIDLRRCLNKSKKKTANLLAMPRVPLVLALFVVVAFGSSGTRYEYALTFLTTSNGTTV